MEAERIIFKRNLPTAKEQLREAIVKEQDSQSNDFKRDFQTTSEQSRYYGPLKTRRQRLCLIAWEESTQF